MHLYFSISLTSVDPLCVRVWRKTWETGGILAALQKCLFLATGVNTLLYLYTDDVISQMQHCQRSSSFDLKVVSDLWQNRQRHFKAFACSGVRVIHHVYTVIYS